MQSQQNQSDDEFYDIQFLDDNRNEQSKNSQYITGKTQDKINVQNKNIKQQSTSKNKYLNKIKVIKKQLNDKSINQKIQTFLSKNQSSFSQSIINCNDDRNSSSNQLNITSAILDKRTRNKQSAKLSRDRKKLYIQMLQEKQKTLTKKLLSKKKQLQQTKNYLDRVVNQNKTMSGFTASRQQMIKKLEMIMKNKQLSIQQRDHELNQIMDNLRYKIGATGKQRINTINEYFRQIVNISLPALHRYMMWSASSQNHLFNQNDEDDSDQWYKQLKYLMNLTQQQKNQIKGKKQFLQEQKKVLEKLINKLKRIKTQIQQKSAELQDLIDGIREILTPVQCANFILFIERNKYRKQLNLYEQMDQESKQKTIKGQQNKEDDRGPIKIIKTQ